jgi:hypothetical protein
VPGGGTTSGRRILSVFAAAWTDGTASIAWAARASVTVTATMRG